MSDWIDRLRAQIKPAEPIPPGQSVWIFGAGMFGRAVARACIQRNIHVCGFVQTTPTQSVVDDLRVVSWTDLSADDKRMPLLIGIHNRDTALDGLVELATNAGCTQVVMPWTLYAQFGDILGWRYWLADPAVLLAHSDDLRRTHARLADDISRACFERIVAFRMGLDLAYSSFSHPDPQYFNALTLPILTQRPLRYLDGGAYTGDSFLELLRHASIKQAWLFEPDRANFAKLAQSVRQQKLPGLCLPLALSDQYALLRFNSGIGEAGNVSPEGNDAIATVAVDDLLAGETIDLLKLDVEGSEAAALRGAAQTLKASRPVLTISAYHHPDDLWVLPDLLAELCEGYRFYLRQHTNNSFELVLYGVPGD